MANKGENKTQKALSAPKTHHFNKKERAFVVKSRSGPHARNKSVSLGFLVRDILGKAKSLKEAKIILTGGQVSVDGRVRRSYKYPVGLFDVVEFFALKERYRVIFDSKGRIKVIQLDEKDQLFKICKIVGKRKISGNKLQLSTNDGRSLLSEENVSVGDSIKLELPKQKIVSVYPFEKGVIAYFLSGGHISSKAVIENIQAGNMKRSALVDLIENGKKVQTTSENLMIIGKEKEEIELATKV